MGNGDLLYLSRGLFFGVGVGRIQFSVLSSCEVDLGKRGDVDLGSCFCL